MKEFIELANEFFVVAAIFNRNKLGKVAGALAQFMFKGIHLLNNEAQIIDGKRYWMTDRSRGVIDGGLKVIWIPTSRKDV